MSIRRFKFVSPGVFLNEIDNSQLPRGPREIGPVVIGRLQKGPSNRPVTVSSFSEFVEIFGPPVAGGNAEDVWRDGNTLAPTYAAYAAQAYLRNAGPVTVVRTLGEAHPQAQTAGAAGWSLTNAHAATGTPGSGTGGAYGLFLFTSGSGQTDSFGSVHIGGAMPGKIGHRQAKNGLTGSLAAAWYFDTGGILLSGSLHGKPDFIREHLSSSKAAGSIAGNNFAIKPSNTTNLEFSCVLFDGSNQGKKVTFNFDRDSDKYIRKVFNTNPTRLGSAVAVVDSSKYFLGETYDRHLKDIHGTSLNAGTLAADSSVFGVILALQDSSANGPHSQAISTQPSKSPWFFAQDLGAETSQFDAGKMQKLFRLCALDSGESAQREFKVTITDMKNPTAVNPYGSFTLQLRDVRDSDNAPIILEQYGNLNLNPNSANYIASRIGDQYQEWDTSENRYRLYGNYPNQSIRVRVEMNEDVDAGLTDTRLLPFGFKGPPRSATSVLGHLTVATGSNNNRLVNAGKLLYTTTDVAAGTSYREDQTMMNYHALTGAALAGTTVATPRTHGTVGIPAGTPIKTTGFFGSFVPATGALAVVGVADDSAGTPDAATVLFPSLPLRISSSDGGISDQKRACFGISTARSPGVTRFDESYYDVVRYHGEAANVWDESLGSTEPSFIFTLDDLVENSSAGNTAPRSVSSMHYLSGSRKHLAASYTAKRGSYSDLVDAGFANFTAPMYGGFDGLDIKEREPLGEHIISAADSIYETSAGLHSLKRCIDSVADPEVVEMNLLTVPGVRNTKITDLAISTCENRADALAIIDVENNGYAPTTETKASFKTRITDNNVGTCVTAVKRRGFNSSYAAAYYPWVRIFDEINGQQVWVPPSIAALGTFASSQRNSELWFAPAGFTRGGLSEGSAGLPVIGVSQRLTSKDRDELYDVNINPIAQFPAEGIVIFGQKTLQATPSALDRINVRRLMIFIKKQVSRIASRLLFDQNVQATWNRFRGQVEPFLDGVKSRLGLTDFRVILDETTTTPDLVDRNIMYAKIFLKPARAIEFIAIDFTITNSGASFDD